jgi:hypothetical protein
MEPSCLLGLANSHLLLESCAEGLQIRFEESNVSAHHAEMGNLLSLNPKIHRLDADAQVHRSFTDSERKLFTSERDPGGQLTERIVLGESFAHALLYGMF